MASIFSIEFNYQGESFYALISTKKIDGRPGYRITIMNGELEKLIAGHQIVDMVNDKLVLDNCNGDVESYKLKKEVVKALSVHLQKQVMTKERYQH